MINDPRAPTIALLTRLPGATSFVERRTGRPNVDTILSGCGYECKPCTIILSWQKCSKRRAWLDSIVTWQLTFPLYLGYLNYSPQEPVFCVTIVVDGTKSILLMAPQGLDPKLIKATLEQG